MSVLPVAWLLTAAVLPAQSPAPILPPQAAPVPAATPTTFPSPDFTPAPLPSMTPPVAIPTAVPGPTPAPRPSAAARPSPRPTSVPPARSSATPPRSASPLSAATSRPIALPSATMVSTPAATPAPPIETVVLPPTRAAAPLWPWVVGVAALALIGAAWAAHWRRRVSGAAVVEDVDTASTALPPSAAAPTLIPGPTGNVRGSTVRVAIRPIRAGLNLISATVEVEVTVANAGADPIGDVRVAVTLLSAHAEQEAELAAVFAQPIPRPAAPPFVLAPGEARTMRSVAALGHHAITPVEAGGRTLFVPLLGVAVRYREGEAERRLGQGYAVGIERAGAAKLQPFSLDAVGRQYDALGARPHGGAVTG